MAFRYAGVRIIKHKDESITVKFHVSSGKDHLKNGEFKPAFLTNPEDLWEKKIFTELPKAMTRPEAVAYIIDDPKFADVRDLMIAAKDDAPKNAKLEAEASVGLQLDQVLQQLQELQASV